MCNEFHISPNHEVMNILLNYSDSHQALMQLNLLIYKNKLEDFVIIHKNFMVEYPNFENKDILDKEIKFIESVILNNFFKL